MASGSTRPAVVADAKYLVSQSCHHCTAYHCTVSSLTAPAVSEPHADVAVVGRCNQCLRQGKVAKQLTSAA